MVVGSFFEKFVVACINDEKVRLVMDQFLHQMCHPIAGVADAAGVDHLPVFIPVGDWQQFAEPTGKGGSVIVRAAVSG